MKCEVHFMAPLLCIEKTVLFDWLHIEKNILF